MRGLGRPPLLGRFKFCMTMSWTFHLSPPVDEFCVCTAPKKGDVIANTKLTKFPSDILHNVCNVIWALDFIKLSFPEAGLQRKEFFFNGQENLHRMLCKTKCKTNDHQIMDVCSGEMCVLQPLETEACPQQACGCFCSGSD